MPNQDSKLDDTFSNHLKEYDKIFFDDSLFWLVSFFTLFYYLIFLFLFRSCTVERVSALVNLQWAFFFFNFFTRKLLGYKNTVSILKQSKSEAKNVSSTVLQLKGPVQQRSTLSPRHSRRNQCEGYAACIPEVDLIKMLASERPFFRSS
jgi:hypothetical protein